MNNKNPNAYVKISLILLISACIGAVVGLSMYFLMGVYGQGIEELLADIMKLLQVSILPALIAITILSVTAGEVLLGKLRGIMAQLIKAGDEESDELEYQEARYAFLSTSLNVASQALSIVILSLGYSSEYLSSSDAVRKTFLCACLVFLVCMVYDSFWQIRYVKLVQKIYPDKKGDPSSRKFREQWLENCDEAEREVVYRSAYKAYITMTRLTPSLLVVTMLCNLFFETGLLAILIPTIIWLVSTVSYSRSCVVLKGEKMLLK